MFEEKSEKWWMHGYVKLKLNGFGKWWVIFGSRLKREVFELQKMQIRDKKFSF